MLHNSIGSVHVNGKIGVRSKDILRALCRGSIVRVNSRISIKRGMAVRKTAVGSCTLIKVKSAVLSRTVINRKTVMTTNSLILDGAMVRPKDV